MRKRGSGYWRRYIRRVRPHLEREAAMKARRRSHSFDDGVRPARFIYLPEARR